MRGYSSMCFFFVVGLCLVVVGPRANARKIRRKVGAAQKRIEQSRKRRVREAQRKAAERARGGRGGGGGCSGDGSSAGGPEGGAGMSDDASVATSGTIGAETLHYSSLSPRSSTAPLFRTLAKSGAASAYIPVTPRGTAFASRVRCDLRPIPPINVYFQHNQQLRQ